MATFNPFGFRGAYSTSAASQANPTLLTFPWNPAYSGWSGDIGIQFLPGGAESLSSTDGYVYPAYIDVTGITVPDGRSLNYPPVVGVIVGFKYTPANNLSLTGDDVWNNYIANTELAPNTTVEVIINTDLQGRYEIQYKGTDALKGITQNYLFGTATIYADETYTVAVGGITFTFAKGRSGTAPSGGGLLGTSTLYLYEPATQTASIAANNVVRPTSLPLFIQTPNNYDNSGWYDDTAPNASDNENNIITVMFNQSFMSQAWNPLILQVPSIS